jgi:hypothetical protein
MGFFQRKRNRRPFLFYLNLQTNTTMVKCDQIRSTIYVHGGNILQSFVNNCKIV